MKLSDFDYELPEALIADRPPATRGGTRLLVLDRKTGDVADRMYRDLPELLQPGDVLVINNTKVIRARLIALTETRAERELLLLERHSDTFDPHRMRAMYRRKLRTGQQLNVGSSQVVIEEIHGDGTATISSTENLLSLADEHGSVPLPPYMKREADQSDIERYQTVFAEEAGSVAAPTASLNLTDEILDKIKAKGVIVAELTLHVGLGTFMPIRTDDVTEHVMHSEYYAIPATTIAAIQSAKKNSKRVVAVGTTVTRTLEYTAESILQHEASNDIQGEANIFIYPGYEFKVVDAMLTNFHAPHSTVLMMAAAFAGWDHLKVAYTHAVESEYKFFSYGDSMFIC
ncbi:MAG: queA [Candidatus Saccharibacteria bacterium]|nr:queA [Candidatus Saccharibacteria bacterium]